jgi:LacI family xylobiose transport system transcriptional regulator
LAEVAALADVSVSTVSKVLNGRRGVSSQTRARIESLLTDNEYSRRAAGSNPAPLIEVLCYEIDSAWAAEAIAAIDRLARESGVGLVISGTNERREPDTGWIKGVLNRRPVGVITIVSTIDEQQKKQLRSRNIPIVMIDPAGQPQLVRGDQAPHRTGPSADRDRDRARGHDGRDRPILGIPGSTGQRRHRFTT